MARHPRARRLLRGAAREPRSPALPAGVVGAGARRPALVRARILGGASIHLERCETGDRAFRRKRRAPGYDPSSLSGLRRVGGPLGQAPGTDAVAHYRLTRSNPVPADDAGNEKMRPHSYLPRCFGAASTASSAWVSALAVAPAAPAGSALAVALAPGKQRTPGAPRPVRSALAGRPGAWQAVALMRHGIVRDGPGLRSLPPFLRQTSRDPAAPRGSRRTSTRLQVRERAAERRRQSSFSLVAVGCPGFVRISASRVRRSDTPDTRCCDFREMGRRDACSRSPRS